MDKALIFNWNKTVDKDDTVYILGDFVWKTGEVSDYCKQLKGHKILILGNHDRPTGSDRRFFDGIYNYLEIKDGNFNVIMSHYPMLSYKKDFLDTTVHLFGHVHVTKEWDIVKNVFTNLRKSYSGVPDNRCQAINVGCMMPWIDYVPRSIDYLVNKLDQGEIYGI